MTKKVLAIIPARGGSKGLLKKNILDLVGKPLLAWTIEASLQSRYITRTIVSSDDDDILNIASSYDANVLKRPDEYSTDMASSEIVVKHVIESLDEEFDYIILLQPTSPLRTSIDIDGAFESLFSSGATGLISVTYIDNKILKAFKENDKGYIEGISNNEYPFMRRQELPTTYISNGAIYIVDCRIFKIHNSFFTQNTIKFLMSENKSIDIDTLEDLLLAEKIIKEEQNYA